MTDDQIIENALIGLEDRLRDVTPIVRDLGREAAQLQDRIQQRKVVKRKEMDG